MSSLTPFQEKKILRVFSMLYDSNNDGVIEKQDFDILLAKICDILEWSHGSEKYVSAKDTLDTVWTGLMEYADTNKDAKVTKDEWLKMWGDCLYDIQNGRFPDWQKRYMDLMFDVNDKSGDDYIDQEEYTTFMSQFGMSDSDCERSFKLVSGGNNISRDEFSTLWKDYLSSNDESASANYLFGPNLDD